MSFGQLGAGFGNLGIATSGSPFVPFDGASIDIDFVSGGSIGVSGPPSSYLTTTRATPPSAYVNDSGGNWSGVAPNLPRISNLGLLVEESRTNSIRNNSMQDAVPGSPGTLPTNWSTSNNSGLAPSVVGTGTQNGIDYIDLRLQGTAVSGATNLNFDSSTAIAATTGQTWAQSVFMAVTAGSQTNVSSITLVESLRGAAGAFLTNSTTTIAVDALFTKKLQIQTLVNASLVSVQPGISITLAAGAVDVTLRIGWPQIELGASVTSPIRTTTVAVARSADVVSLTTPPAFGSAYSLFAKGTPQSPLTYTNSQNIIQIDDGTGNNRVQAFKATATGVFGIQSVSASVATNFGSASIWAVNTSAKLAAAIAAADQASSVNGATVVSGVGALPIAVANVRVGSNSAGTASWNGFVERIALWPTTRILNASLQTITS